MNSVFYSIELLLLTGALVAILARKLGIPYTVGLVAAGLALGTATDGIDIHLSRDLIFTVFLPPLIFEASIAISWKDLRADLVPILFLALFGVLLSGAVSAAGAYFLLSWSAGSALVFGAMLAATDPVSVIAIFKEAKLRGRTRLLVEAESIMNDGTAAVLYTVVLAVAGGTAVQFSGLSWSFFREAGGGILIGSTAGGLILWVSGKTEDHLVETAFTTIAAYGSFLAAQSAHCSGVISTLVCGLVLGNLGSGGAFSDRGREVADAFWEYAAFLANTLIFLLIGNELAQARLLEYAPAIAAAYFMSLASRAAAVYGSSALLSRSRWSISPRDCHVLFWGGMRGALTLALALGLPPDMPGRAEVITVTFGTVALSIVTQGVTIPALLRRLGHG